MKDENISKPVTVDSNGGNLKIILNVLNVTYDHIGKTNFLALLMSF